MAQCHCIIRHPTTSAERDEMTAALVDAQREGDDRLVVVLMASLAGGCEAAYRPNQGG